MSFGCTDASDPFVKAICITFRELHDITASCFDVIIVYSKYSNYYLS